MTPVFIVLLGLGLCRMAADKVTVKNVQPDGGEWE